MALQFQLAQTPSLSDLPFYNYSGADIPSGISVSIDTVNLLGNAGVPGIGIVLPAASGNPVVGVTQEIIKAGSYGRVRTGGLAQTTASGAITAGTFVDAEITTGFAKVHVAAKAQIGMAMTTAANGDPVLVLVAPALNA
jgi:hypothetical protein